MSTLDQDPHQVEARRCFGVALGFLKSAEVKYPDLAKQLPNLLNSMLGGQAFEPSLMTQNEGFINGGVAALGYWLQRNGFGGFEVKAWVWGILL